MFSTVTSAFFSISLTISSPFGDFKLIASDFLLTLNWWKYHGSSSGLPGRRRRPGSPRPGFSILTTSAPNQASTSVEVVPASNWVKSTTLTPCRKLRSWVLSLILVSSGLRTDTGHSLRFIAPACNAPQTRRVFYSFPALGKSFNAEDAKDARRPAWVALHVTSTSSASRFCLLLPLRRMRAYEFLVNVGAPAGALRQDKVAILDDRGHGDDVVLPFDVVDVDLHDFEVRHHGAHMRADQRAEMAVEIMRRDIDLVGVSHGRDLDRFEDTVPGYVDDRVIDRLVLKIRPELAPAVQ